MIASTKSLYRLAERKLRRWGITPIVRDDIDMVMLCQDRPIYLPLNDFFTVLQYNDEIRPVNPNESVFSVLNNRIKKHENAFDRYTAHLNTMNKDREQRTEDLTGEFCEVLKSSEKIQVQVR